MVAVVLVVVVVVVVVLVLVVLVVLVAQLLRGVVGSGISERARVSLMADPTHPLHARRLLQYPT